jgi:hypothetical protein
MMTHIEISEVLAEQLKDIAQQENQSIDDLIAQWIKQHRGQSAAVSEYEAYNLEKDSLSSLANLALEADIRTGEINISERSREILTNEYPEYLLRRMRENDDAGQ